MALILKGLPQVSQDGKSLWNTDKTGEYVVTTNEGGWGAPNFELDESALLFFIYRMSTPKVLIDPISSAVKHDASAENTDETVFQGTYLADGVHELHTVRLMVSTNDANSIDGTPVVFTEGDIWYNKNDALVKQLVNAVATTLDITNTDVLDAITTNSSVTVLLCEQIFYKDLSIKKQEIYNSGVVARREEDSTQIKKARQDQIDILLGTAASSYEFSFGLKVQAQNTIETLLDDFKIS